MNYMSSFGNFLAEMAMHVTRYFMLWLLYKYVVRAVVLGLPEVSWEMGVLIYSLLAVSFTINLRVGSD